MGTIQNGILGGFNGKVGTVVGSHWKGVSVIRARPKGNRTKFSDAQLQQQAKFALMVRFLQQLSDFMNLTYKKATTKMSGFNKVLSENIQTAIAGVFPAYTVDYTKVVLSKGTLPNANNVAAASAVAGKLAFTWVDNTGTNTALSSDIAFVAAYNELLNQWIYVANAGTRNAGTYTLDVAPFSGKTVQAYIGFMSADLNRVSPSVYAGQVNVL